MPDTHTPNAHEPDAHMPDTRVPDTRISEITTRDAATADTNTPDPVTESPAEKGWADLGRFWTLPNVLTLSRLVLIVPVTWLILVDGRLLWILGLVIVAIMTDYLDGRVARWSHSVSDWGKVLDPLTDKLGGGMVVAALTFRGSLPLWFLVIIIIRDLAILTGGAIIRRRTGEIMMSMFSGKIAVTAVAITVLAALLKADLPIMQFCLTASVFLLSWSFIRYLTRFFQTYRRSQTGASATRDEN